MSSSFTSDQPIHSLVRAWTGTANASASVELSDGVEVRRNLALNPNFEAGLTGYGSSVGATMTRDTTTFHGGTASLKVVGTGATGYSSAYPADRTDLVPGATYTWSFWFKIPADLSATSLPQVGFYAGSTYLSTAYASSIQLATDWQRMSITFTVPPTTTRVTFSFGSINGRKTTDVVYLDDVQLEQAPAATDYFDGNTAPDYEYGELIPLLVTQWNATATTRHLVHDVLGNPWPDITVQPAGPRTGTMSALFDNETDANDLFLMLTGTEAVTFSDDSTSITAMRLLANGSVTIAQDDQDRTKWVVTFAYQEVQ